MGNVLAAVEDEEVVEPECPDVISVEVSPKKKGETPIRRHYHYPERLTALPDDDKPHMNTVFAAFEESVNNLGHKNMLGHREKLPNGEASEYIWESYRDVHVDVKQIASGLRLLGLKKQAHVSILSINRPEWVKAVLSIWALDMKCVPLYDTLGPTSVTYILNHAEVSVVFAAGDKLAVLFKDAKEMNYVKTVISFDEFTEEQKKQAAALKWELITLKDFQERGSKNPCDFQLPTPESIAYIMYTSGTTGDPKGVILSHQNILASAAGLTHLGITLTSDDVHISYLPLAHSFETCVQVLGMCVGGSVGFYQGDPKKLLDDLAALKPTLFCGVPRVFSRIYDRVFAMVNEGSPLKKALFDRAYEVQRGYVAQGTRSALLDLIVFNKLKARLGGRCRLICTGAAPMPDYVMEFLRTAFGVPVFQGYGMTENAAAACAMPPGFLALGTVGAPIPSTEVKLVDVPEMNYTSEDKPCPRGEVCLRGPNVFSGYYKLPDKTAEALDSEGWLHTGDIGRFNEDGSLQIIDRKKNIFKLAQGEFVASEELEMLFQKCKYISQMFLYGNSFKTMLVAVVVPHFETIPQWAAANGITGDFKTIAGDARVKKLIMDDLLRIGKEAKIAGFKFPKDVFVETNINELGQGFSIENECMTPSFKLRRPQLLARYQVEIDKMYKALGE